MVTPFGPLAAGFLLVVDSGMKSGNLLVLCSVVGGAAPVQGNEACQRKA